MQDFQSKGDMPKPFARPDAARLQRQQAALLEFGGYALREPLLFNILTEAARVCAESLGVPFCKVCRYRVIEGDLLVEAGFGWHAGIVGLVVSKADETSPQGRAFITGQPVIISNLREANNITLPAFYGQHGITSTIDVIIKGLDGAPYGFWKSPVRPSTSTTSTTWISSPASRSSWPRRLRPPSGARFGANHLRGDWQPGRG
jgi:hypothetical protein